MKSRSILVLTSACVALLVADSVVSKQLGILPNDVVGTFNVGSLTRTAATSCGQCHTFAHTGTTVTVAPAARSVLAGQTTAITISGTSTKNSTQTTGGFCADVTKGTLVAGANSRINTAGTAVTHRNRNSRSWTFNWRAPAAAGLAELYTVVNCTDGTRIPAPTGDSWGFHGATPTATLSTPVRLYANAATGVKPTGESCPDGFGNYSVLGAPLVPTRGQTFRLEAFGMAPSAPLLVMFSIGGNVPPIDLAAAGAPGCVLRTLIQVQAVAGTTAGNASRAEGSFILPFTIPSNVPRGTVFAAQFAYIDNASKRPFPFTVTNGVECTVQ